MYFGIALLLVCIFLLASKYVFWGHFALGPKLIIINERLCVPQWQRGCPLVVEHKVEGGGGLDIFLPVAHTVLSLTSLSLVVASR
jgi:hypothetical protein